MIIGHPDKNSFCHNGIFKTIINTFGKHQTQNVKIVDLYKDKLHRDKKDLVVKYKDLVTWSNRILIWVANNH